MMRDQANTSDENEPVMKPIVVRDEACRAILTSIRSVWIVHSSTFLV